MAFSRYVTRPRLLFKYDMDVIIYTIIIAFVPIIIGVFTTKLISGMIIGFIFGYLFLKNYPKIVRNRIAGWLEHLFYDIGLLDPNKKNDTKKIPPGFINEFNE